MHKLPIHQRLEAVKKVLFDGQALGKTALAYGCSRQTLWRWVKLYKKTKSAEGIRDHYVSGARHPKANPRTFERQVLDLVVKNPSLSAAGLVRDLGSRGTKVSASSVYRVLLKNELMTRQLRRRFSL